MAHWDYGVFTGDENPSDIPAAIGSIQWRWNFWPIYDIISGNFTCNFDGVTTTNSLNASVQAGTTMLTQ